MSIKMALSTTAAAAAAALLLVGMAMAAPQAAPELGSPVGGSGGVSGPLSSGRDMDWFQKQIYIISGTFGGLLLLLILLVLALALAIARMKNQLKQRQDNYLSSEDMDSKSPGNTAAAGNNGNINAYVNEGFNNSHEMAERREVRGSSAGTPREPVQTEVNRLGYEVYQAGGGHRQQQVSTENRTSIPRARSSDHTRSHHQLNMEESVAPNSSTPPRDRRGDGSPPGGEPRNYREYRPSAAAAAQGGRRETNRGSRY